MLVQDYHLLLVPKMLRALRPDLRIAHFTHTPWAPPEYFRILPDTVGREVLEGMLGAARPALTMTSFQPLADRGPICRLTARAG